MPSHCRTIETPIWSDERFFSLNSDAKLIFLYAITCDQSDWSGLFPMSIALAEERTGISRKRVLSALRSLEETGLIVWDNERSVIWVVNMWSKQVRATPSKSQLRGVVKHLGMLPQCSNKQAFIEHYQRLGYFDGYPIDTLSIPSQDPPDRVEKREERRERREERGERSPGETARSAQNKRAENAQAVRRLIVEARRKLGIASRETEPKATAIKQANKPLESGHTMDDWRTVIDRAVAANRKDIEAARKYLTLSTLHRPDNFARMLERDDLDGQSQPGGDW